VGLFLARARQLPINSFQFSINEPHLAAERLTFYIFWIKKPWSGEMPDQGGVHGITVLEVVAAY